MFLSQLQPGSWPEAQDLMMMLMIIKLLMMMLMMMMMMLMMLMLMMLMMLMIIEMLMIMTEIFNQPCDGVGNPCRSDCRQKTFLFRP